MRLLQALPVLAALFATTAHADVRWGNENQWNRPNLGYRACLNMNYDSSKVTCMEVVRQGYIAPEAAEICGQQTSDSNKILCLKAALNHNYEAAAVDVCGKMKYQTSVPICMETVADARYNNGALRVCAGPMADSERISCLKSIRHKYFQDEALEVCRHLQYTSSTTTCIDSIADRSFDFGVLQICASQASDSGKISCLQTAGHQRSHGRQGDNWNRPYPRDSHDVAVEAVLDAIDVILRQILAGNGYHTGFGATCRVVNSNGTFLGTVSEDRLNNAGAAFASNQGSCVVTNIKGVNRTRTLIAADGQVLGVNLTEKETSDLKRAYGFDRCRIMTCER